MKNIDEVVRFHGHQCPGLAIGIRVAEAAVSEMGERPGDEEVVAIVETDNCAVDAIQFITGCTFGKGNLILLDNGKNAFRFIRRKDGKAIRIVVKPQPPAAEPAGLSEMMNRWRHSEATPEEVEIIKAHRDSRTAYILNAPLEELLEINEIEAVIPHKARLFNSVACQACGENTMEIRLRPLDGKLYCPECFEKKLASR